MKPTFSLLHPTKRLPDGWRLAYEDWMRKCADPDFVEYLLVVDKEDLPKVPDTSGVGLVVNKLRPCTVDSWNVAAKVCSGDILVCVADDWFPCDRWDEAILRAIPDVKKEVAVWPAGEIATAGLMICPILTRAYFERPGRGGHPHGELFYAGNEEYGLPGYISVGNDDDFTEVALRDGVVVRIPEEFEHRHPSAGLAPMDEVYHWSNRQAAWDRKVEVITRRRAEGYSR